MSRGPGRPREEGAKRVVLTAKVSEADRDLLRRAAGVANTSVSDLVRTAAVMDACGVTRKGQADMNLRRFPRYEPGNMTSYDVTLARVSPDQVLVALWPGLHCSACVLLHCPKAHPAERIASVDYIMDKLRINEADATPLLGLIHEEAPRLTYQGA